LLHLIGCLYYCIRDARSHKHQILWHCQISSHELTNGKHLHWNMKCRVYIWSLSWAPQLSTAGAENAGFLSNNDTFW